MNSSAPLAAPLRFKILGGSEITADTARHATHLLMGDGQHGPDEVLCADSDAAFVEGARKLSVWPKVERALESFRLAQEHRQQTDEDHIRDQQMRVVAHVRRGIADLATAMGKRAPDDEVLLRAAMGKPPLEPPVFDPILMYDKPFETSPPLGGPEGASSLPLPTGTWPVLGWFGWDNRARGVRIFGGAVLCENIWFSGRRFWVFGLNGLIPLGPVGFDRIVSSAQVF